MEELLLQLYEKTNARDGFFAGDVSSSTLVSPFQLPTSAVLTTEIENLMHLHYHHMRRVRTRAQRKQVWYVRGGWNADDDTSLRMSRMALVSLYAD